MSAKVPDPVDKHVGPRQVKRTILAFAKRLLLTVLRYHIRIQQDRISAVFQHVIYWRRN